jgi:peptidylprolyl isomerase
MIQQSELKTPLKTRIIIGIIAAAMIISTAALYVGMVLGNNNPTSSQTLSASEEVELQALMDEYQTQLGEQAQELSGKYFADFAQFKSRVKAFNAAAITEIKTTDLKTGDGAELAEGDINYSAYYIGWCADESIFDSSLDNPQNPTALNNPLDGSNDLIEGWKRGLVGMHLGGIREVEIPGELAYGATREICGGTNSPLKFIIMPIEPATQIPVSDRLWDLYQRKYGAQ